VSYITDGPDEVVEAARAKLRKQTMEEEVKAAILRKEP
jgi:hypothetical protein